MGNDNLSKVVGKGDACLMIENGMRLVLRDVRHIPNMRLNLIFVDRFDNEGFCNTFKNGKWKLTKGSLVEARGIKQSRLYMMQAKLSSDVYEAPEKVWSRKNVSYGHLWVFGFKAFVHVPKDERSKLDVKTRQCAFIGYGQHQFGNRFYDSIQKKLVRSCDARFVENQFIKDIDKVQKAIFEPNGDSTNVELIPLTVGSRQVRDDI
ncbi:hypothetical protein GH714_011777 [Hevea brasiliensis]|uniref:Retrovirus-related Pol polyprotein from transposon TNT 1-94 n=1 Tax=Hevea brasiliensis TaxID=3981 RepID=A0A6A6KZJ7_HEVBR|nr:hypothetical protein GH714_011777 [Hevea brasiliensis]